LQPYQGLKKIFEKTLAVNKDLAAGHHRTVGDVETKKPAGRGLPAPAFREVIGKPLRQAQRRYDFLKEEDL
ncbi:MAG: N-acetylneuraminate synthase, partial [Bacteroidota bacterium]